MSMHSESSGRLATGGTAAPGAPTRTTTGRRPIWVAWVALLPAVLLVIAFFALPVVQAVRISLSQWSGIGPVEFTGFDQYEALFTSVDFYRSLGLTIGFAVASAIGIVVIATLLAATISQGVKGAGFYRVVWFIPGVAPAAAVAVFWGTAFQPGFGTVNYLLGLAGLDSNSAPLADPNNAIYPVIFVSVWSGVGFAFILILGAMEQIPVSVYEAAKIDGASSARQFFSITLPLVRPVLSITATLNLIWAFNNFTTVWGLTKGGPGTATTTLPVLVYKNAFQLGEYSQATAVAVVASVILLALGLVALRLSQSREQFS